MASSPSPSSSSSEKPKKSGQDSELPSDLFPSEDVFSSEYSNPNYDTGFQTAPSSPQHANISADSSSPHKESTTETSSPPSPKLLQQPNTSPSSVVLKGRDAVPSHHLLKVECFSSLSKAPLEKYISEFVAGGYKWNMSIYPTGDKSKDGEGHISVYLEMVDTSSLPAGWEVNAIFNFFIFHQLQDKYFSPQDATVRRFHCQKTQWGIVKFIDLETFNNPSNGYLVNDTCSFGAEVFIVKTSSKAERLSMINNPPTSKISWILHDVSNVNRQCRETQSFAVGDYKWRVFFYPRGHQVFGKIKNDNFTIALELASPTLAAGTKLFVHFTVCMMDKKEDKHVEKSGRMLISSRCYWDFMSQAKFNDPENGFLVNDSCTIEADLKVLASVTLE